MDYKNRRIVFVDRYVIRAFDLTTKAVTAVAGTSAKKRNRGRLDGPCQSVMFRRPTGIAIDPTDGCIIACDRWSRRIVRIDEANDRVATIAGNDIGSRFHFADGIGSAAEFGSPEGVCCDSKGRAIVCDVTNQRLRLLTPIKAETTTASLTSYTVTTIAGNGTSVTTDGPLLSAGLFSPSAIAIDPYNDSLIFVGCRSRIRKVDLTRGM